MVDSSLLEQVMRLDLASRLELRDAIEASVVGAPLAPDLVKLLSDRIAADNSADHDRYITLDRLERETLDRRAQPTA